PPSTLKAFPRLYALRHRSTPGLSRIRLLTCQSFAGILHSQRLRYRPRLAVARAARKCRTLEMSLSCLRHSLVLSARDRVVLPQMTRCLEHLSLVHSQSLAD